jgi:hypothetical protein
VDSVVGVVVAVGVASFFINQRRSFAAAIAGRRQKGNAERGRIGERRSHELPHVDGEYCQTFPGSRSISSSRFRSCSPELQLCLSY